MDEDLLDPPSNSVITRSAPPIIQPLRPLTVSHILHGPSPQPPRQRGIVITDRAPSLPKPILGESPPKGKGKSTCKQDEPLEDGYETSDSDEESFQNALTAIFTKEKGGSSSGAAHPQDTTAPPKAPGGPDDSAVLPPSPSYEHVPRSHSFSDRSELFGDILAHSLDEEPISIRAKRLLRQKEKTHKLCPITPPPKAKPKSSNKNPKPTSVRFSPAIEVRTPSNRKPSASPRKPIPAANRSSHRPRSRTKKTTNSSSSVTAEKERIDISATPIEYVATPTVKSEQSYRHSIRPIPRRSVRIQVHTTQTPIMKRAQKRKAAGSTRTKGNPLLQSYPYNRLTIEQVNDLFRVYHIKLGTSPHERAVIIAAIKHMGRQQFEQVLLNLPSINNDQQGETTLSLAHLVDRTDAVGFKQGLDVVL